MTHFDRVDTAEGYTRLHSFGVCTGTPFCDFSREFRVLVSAVTGTERTLAPRVDVVLEVVRMAVNEQVPSLMPTFTLVRWQRARSRTLRWTRCGRRLAIYQIIKLLPSTANFFFQAEDGIRDPLWSRGLGDVYKRQA